MSVEILTPAQQDAQYGGLLDEIRLSSGKDYSDVFGFHPYGHALGVENRADGHLIDLEKAGASDLPSHFVLGYSALKHDSGLPFFHGVGGFEKLDPNSHACPEDLSIEIAKSDGKEAGIDELTLEEVGENIDTTKSGVRAKSWGGFVLCLSDIEPAGHGYKTRFLPDGEQLLGEWRLVKGDITRTEHQDFTAWLLSRYVFTNLRGAEQFSADIDPVNFFEKEITAIENNVRRLALNRIAEEAISIEDYARTAFPQAPERAELCMLLGLRAA